MATEDCILKRAIASKFPCARRPIFSLSLDFPYLLWRFLSHLLNNFRSLLAAFHAFVNLQQLVRSFDLG